MGAGGGTYNAPINFSQILFLLLNEKYDIIKGDIYKKRKEGSIKESIEVRRSNQYYHMITYVNLQ